MSHVPRSAAFGLEQTCFKMFRNSSFLDLRLQGVDVTCAALRCIRFGPDVCPDVSLFQFLHVFECLSTCFVISVSSGLRLQGIDVTCAALSCIRFGPDVFETVS